MLMDDIGSGSVLMMVGGIHYENEVSTHSATEQKRLDSIPPDTSLSLAGSTGSWLRKDLSVSPAVVRSGK